MKKHQEAVFVYSRDFERCHYPDDCPFKTAKAARTRQIAASMGLFSAPNVREVVPEAADRPTLARFHAEEYLDALETAGEGHS